MCDLPSVCGKPKGQKAGVWTSQHQWLFFLIQWTQYLADEGNEAPVSLPLNFNSSFLRGIFDKKKLERKKKQKKKTLSSEILCFIAVVYNARFFLFALRPNLAY